MIKKLPPIKRRLYDSFCYFAGYQNEPIPIRPTSKYPILAWSEQDYTNGLTDRQNNRISSLFTLDPK